ncbi:MAG TPA: prohibitin family protein [Thermodesulfobacteriota bacterium]|nr:prohibitin family protein [Thermodesulfobacteriota bacterium]
MIVLLLVVIFFLTLLLTFWSVTSRSGGREGGGQRVSPAMSWLQARLTARRAAFLAVLGVLLLFGLSSVTVIEAGHRGVVFNVFEGVRPRPLDAGLHLVLPVVNQVTSYDVRSQTYSMVAGGEDGARKGQSDTLWATTADGLKVGLDVTVRYRPDPGRLPELHATIGPDYEEKVVRPQIRNVARMVVAEHPVADVYGRSRAAIQRQIFDQLKGAFARDGIVLEDVLLRNIAFSPDFEKAVEAKLTAAQKVQELEFMVQQARMRAEARQREAAGEAAAFEIVTRTIEKNPRLLEYLWINKLAPSVKIVVVPKGQEGFILNPGPLVGGEDRAEGDERERTAQALSGSGGSGPGRGAGK